MSRECFTDEEIINQSSLFSGRLFSDSKYTYDLMDKFVNFFHFFLDSLHDFNSFLLENNYISTDYPHFCDFVNNYFNETFKKKPEPIGEQIIHYLHRFYKNGNDRMLLPIDCKEITTNTTKNLTDNDVINMTNAMKIYNVNRNKINYIVVDANAGIFPCIFKDSSTYRFVLTSLTIGDSATGGTKRKTKGKTKDNGTIIGYRSERCKIKGNQDDTINSVDDVYFVTNCDVNNVKTHIKFKKYFDEPLFNAFISAYKTLTNKKSDIYIITSNYFSRTNCILFYSEPPDSYFSYNAKQGREREKFSLSSIEFNLYYRHTGEIYTAPFGLSNLSGVSINILKKLIQKINDAPNKISYDQTKYEYTTKKEDTKNFFDNVLDLRPIIHGMINSVTNDTEFDQFDQIKKDLTFFLFDYKRSGDYEQVNSIEQLATTIDNRISKDNIILSTYDRLCSTYASLQNINNIWIHQTQNDVQAIGGQKSKGLSRKQSKAASTVALKRPLGSLKNKQTNIISNRQKKNVKTISNKYKKNEKQTMFIHRLFFRKSTPKKRGTYNKVTKSSFLSRIINNPYYRGLRGLKIPFGRKKSSSIKYNRINYNHIGGVSLTDVNVDVSLKNTDDDDDSDYDFDDFDIFERLTILYHSYFNLIGTRNTKRNEVLFIQEVFALSKLTDFKNKLKEFNEYILYAVVSQLNHEFSGINDIVNTELRKFLIFMDLNENQFISNIEITDYYLKNFFTYLKILYLFYYKDNINKLSYRSYRSNIYHELIKNINYYLFSKEVNGLIGSNGEMVYNFDIYQRYILPLIVHPIVSHIRTTYYNIGGKSIQKKKRYTRRISKHISISKSKSKSKKKKLSRKKKSKSKTKK